MTSLIRTNMDAVRAHSIFESNNSKMSKAFLNVSTGLKINSVQDNPTDWAVSERMRERINSLNQANQNVQNDTAMMKTAEGAIANTVDILRTIKARVINAANASTNEEDRAVLAKEINNLLEQVEDNAYNTKYNGINLLDGTYAAVGSSATTGGDSSTSLSLYFQVGDSTDTRISVNIGDLSLNGLGLSGVGGGSGIYTRTVAGGGGYSNAVKPGITTQMLSASAGLSAAALSGGFSAGGSIANAYDLIKAMDFAINMALSAATSVGSLENRLGYTADNVATQIENLQASDSVLRDSDMAKEIADYMKWTVLSQASQYMLAQSNQNAFSVLNLLQ